MNNYAEINPSLNYSTNVPYFSTFNNKQKYSPVFSKYQDNMKHEGNEYYCGGNSKYALAGIQIEPTPLSNLFFSNENMKRIQNAIKQQVYLKSNKKFKLDVDQSNEDLLIVMRSVFLEEAKHFPDHIVRQTKILNQKTLETVVPGIITNIKQQYKYIQDISTQPVPLPPPLNVNSKGRKSLPSPTSVWGF